MGNYGAEWEAGGYYGSGPVASLIGSLRGRTVVVCGGAAGVFRELEQVCEKIKDPVIFAVNDIGMFLPRIDHWVSLHSDHLGAWKAVRWLQPRAMERTEYHSIEQRPFVNHVWNSLRPLFCLSGYFAMQIAHIMDAERIILCGCPGDRKRRFFEGAPPPFNYGGGTSGTETSTRDQLVSEMKRLPDFKEKVRSMSGWTHDFFGGL